MTHQDVHDILTKHSGFPGGTTRFLREDDTWAVPSGGGGGGSGTNTNEDNATALVNATAVGDAGSRANHFLGSVVPSGWTSSGSSFYQQVVKNSSLGIAQASGGERSVRINGGFSPSGAFRVEGRISVQSNYGTGGDGVWLFVWNNQLWQESSPSGKNGVAMGVDTNGNFVAWHFVPGSGWFQLNVTSGGYAFGTWVYVALERDASSNWKYAWSADRALWLDLVTGDNHPFTVDKVGFRWGALTNGSVDFFDVVS